jgi:hypothetical protein
MHAFAKDDYFAEYTQAIQRIKDLEKVLKALVAADQGLHDDPDRPTTYVRLSTDLRVEIDDLLEPQQF